MFMSFLKDFISFINGFRKWSIMMILILIGIGFRLTNYLSGKEMVDLLSLTGVAFMSANSVEHIGKAVTEWLKNRKSAE
jgi:predicted MFS family arabinose efflux permease